MLLFLVLFLLSGLVALGFLIFGGKRITLAKFGLQMGVQLLACAALAALSYHTNTGDTETVSGWVTGKTTEHVHCRHSYDCNCYTTCHTSSKGNTTCHEHCSTCYEHRFDVHWDVQSTLENYSIDTVDRQGLQEPPRWTATKVGEPVADKHSYTNYIKGNPDTLFRRDGDYVRFKDTLPAYPQRLYDYWHIDRVVTVGGAVADAAALNAELAVANANLGARKQVNIILVLVKGQPKEWFYALQQAWLGGKKNDFIVVMGLGDDGQSILWVDTMAWAKDDIVKVTVRDDLLAMNPWTGTTGDPIAIIAKDVDQYYVRKPMAEFKYLEDAVKPSMTAWVVTLILSLLIAAGMGVFVYENDVFDEELMQRYNSRGTNHGGPG